MGALTVRLRSHAVALISILAGLAVWELSSRAGLLPQSSFPSLAQVASALADQLASEAFWGSVTQTLQTWALGLLIAVSLGVPIGVLMGSSSAVARSLTVTVEFLKPVPPVALIPLGLIVWGPTQEMKVVLVAFGAVWPVLVQTVYGVAQVDPLALDMAKVHHVSRAQTLARIVVPSITPFVATGVRVAASIALIVTIVTELVGGAPGLGKDLVLAQSAGALPQMYALVVVTGFLGLLLNMVLQRVERPVLHWHPTHRGSEAA